MHMTLSFDLHHVKRQHDLHQSTRLLCVVQSKLRLPRPVEHVQPGALPAAETALCRIRPKARAYKHNRTTSSANVILRPFTYAAICKRRFPRRSPAMRGSALNSGGVSLVLMTELRYSPYCIRSRKVCSFHTCYICDHYPWHAGLK